MHFISFHAICFCVVSIQDISGCMLLQWNVRRCYGVSGDGITTGLIFKLYIRDVSCSKFDPDASYILYVLSGFLQMLQKNTLIILKYINIF